MSFKTDMINNAVTRLFEPPRIATAARRQLLTGAGTALLVLAALTIDGVLAWLLWLWVAHRAFGLAMLLWAGNEMVEERQRRLDAIGPEARAILTAKKIVRNLRGVAQ